LASVAAENNSPVSFKRDVAPILVQKCLGCHNAEKAKGNYRLHTFEARAQTWVAAEDTPITPGQPKQSRLFQLISARDENDRMPQNDDALPTAEIELVRRWINEGAKYDAANPGLLLVTLAPALLIPNHRRCIPSRCRSPRWHFIRMARLSRERLPRDHDLGFALRETGEAHPECRAANALAGLQLGWFLARGCEWNSGRVGEVKLFNAASGDLCAHARYDWRSGALRLLFT
jgi:hypothetical protein